MHVMCRNRAEEGATLCSDHLEEMYDQNAMDLMDEIADLMWSDTPPLSRRELDELVESDFRDGMLDEFARDNLLEIVKEEWIRFVRVRPPPKEVAKSELHALTLDAQNVHTSAVNRQTSATLTLLLETPVPTRVSTLRELGNVWKGRSKKKVLDDVSHWYSTTECRVKNDQLYRRALDGLWVRIKESDHKDALLQRLWEECSDAVGVCCEGHLSRLANVLVGFDDEAEPEVSVGEILQQKMSAIAGLDVSVEHKVGHAWAVFEELGVSAEERTAWIEAL